MMVIRKDWHGCLQFGVSGSLLQLNAALDLTL